MEELELFYESADDIPEGYDKLYTEKEGKWHLTGIKGLKTQADITKLTTTVTKLRGELKTANDKLTAFGSLDPETLADDMAELETLRAEKEAGGGKIDESKIAPIVEARVKSATAKLERERDKLRTDLEAATNENGELKGSIRTARIKDEVRKHCGELKVLSSATEDVELLAERLFDVDADDNVVVREGAQGISAGTTMKDWLSDMKRTRGHWWPAAEGGGGKGGKGGEGVPNNPWTAEHWNITAQGRYLREHGSEKAEKAARVAGSSIGAVSPPKAA